MTDIGNSTDIANAVALQADGKIVVVGTTYRNNDYSNEDFAVVRYLANGTLDTRFGVNGRRSATACRDRATSDQLQAIR